MMVAQVMTCANYLKLPEYSSPRQATCPLCAFLTVEQQHHERTSLCSVPRGERQLSPLIIPRLFMSTLQVQFSEKNRVVAVDQFADVQPCKKIRCLTILAAMSLEGCCRPMQPDTFSVESLVLSHDFPLMYRIRQRFM